MATDSVHAARIDSFELVQVPLVGSGLLRDLVRDPIDDPEQDLLVAICDLIERAKDALVGGYVVRGIPSFGWKSVSYPPFKQDCVGKECKEGEEKGDSLANL